MNKILSWTVSKNNTTVIVLEDGEVKPYSVRGADKGLLEELTKEEHDVEKILGLFRGKDKQALLDKIGGEFKTDGHMVMYYDYVLPESLAERLLRYTDQGLDTERFENFIKNLMSNPLESSRQELILFLESGDFVITEDGHFLAYKYVNEDYTDCRTGTFDNSPGKVVQMPRERVDTDRDRTCSHGLHFCTWDYLPSYSTGRRVVLVKVNPADVVSIPSDYNNTKGRTWRYEVLKDVTEKAREYGHCFLEEEGDEFFDAWSMESYIDEDAELEWCDVCEEYEGNCDC